MSQLLKALQQTQRIKRLRISGHVFNRPHHLTGSTYSWPLGKDWSEVKTLILNAKKAYNVTKVDYEY